MRKATRRLVPLAVTIALVATGCQAPNAGGSPDSLTYWSTWKEGEPQQKVMAQALADFTAETGIDVQVEWQGRAVTQKLVPALNTNKVPDLVDGGYGKLAPVIAETGQAASVAAAYDLDVEGAPAKERVPAKYVGDRTAIKDQQWMMPYILQTDAFWFDAKAHPGLAEKPPATWQELVDVLDESKAAGRTPIAADGDIAGYNSWWFTALYVGRTEPGAFATLASDRTGSAWDSPEALAAAKDVEKLARGDYLINGYGASKWPAQQQAWATGQADLLFNGSWIPTETTPYATEGFSYGSFPFPQVDPSKPTAVRADFTGFAIPAKGRNQDTAAQLATFLLRKKYQDAFGTEAKLIPIREDAETSPELEGAMTALAEAEGNYQQNDGVTLPGYLEKVFWPMDDELFLGKITAEEFVAKMKDAQTAYWKDKQ